MKKLSLILIITFGLIFNLAFTNKPALAACSGGFTSSQCSACAGVSELGSSQNCSTNGKTALNVVNVAINILLLIVGIVSVVMLIFGGFKFITSGGNAEGVKQGKSTIIYAIIGLVIVVLAEVIVHTVLKTTSQVSLIINLQ